MYFIRMKTKDEIIALLSSNKNAITARYPVRKMAVFGSFSRGDQGPQSDVDILVDVDPSIGLEFVSLADQIEKLLGLKVDLVSLGALGPAKLRYIEPELIYV